MLGWGSLAGSGLETWSGRDAGFALLMLIGVGIGKHKPKFQYQFHARVRGLDDPVGGMG